MSEIYKTTDYDQFKIIGANRDVNTSHLKTLAASIARKNLLEQNPIIVNKKMEVIDGQHRLEVCKNNKWPIYYVIRNDADLQDVTMLNANVREWKLADYVESWAKQGNTEYQKLLDFADVFELSLALAARLMSHTIGILGQSHGLMRQLRTGSFTAWNEKGAMDFGQQLHEIRPFVEGANVWKEKAFVQALSVAYSKGMKHVDIMAKLRQSGTKLYKRPTLREYLRQLEEVYNYKRKTDKIFLSVKDVGGEE